MRTRHCLANIHLSGKSKKWARFANTWKAVEVELLYQVANERKDLSQRHQTKGIV